MNVQEQVPHLDTNKMLLFFACLFCITGSLNDDVDIISIVGEDFGWLKEKPVDSGQGLEVLRRTDKIVSV